MAHHRSAHADEAKQWLERATQWIEENVEKIDQDGKPSRAFNWHQRLRLELLRKEAESLIDPEPE